MKLSNLIAENYFCFVLSLSSAGIFLAPVSRTWYPLIPDLAKNFTDHIHHFSFSPVKGIIRTVFSFILVLSCISCHILAQSSDLFVVFRNILEGSRKLSASTALYQLKVFDVCLSSVYL